MWRRRRQGNSTAQTNKNSIVDIVGNEENK
jgi:hypothetical protein